MSKIIRITKKDNKNKILKLKQKEEIEDKEKENIMKIFEEMMRQKFKSEAFWTSPIPPNPFERENPPISIAGIADPRWFIRDKIFVERISDES